MWGKVFILAFMCFIVWIAMFGWFWYENFVLKDVSLVTFSTIVSDLTKKNSLEQKTQLCQTFTSASSK